MAFHYSGDTSTPTRKELLALRERDAEKRRAQWAKQKQQRLNKQKRRK